MLVHKTYFSLEFVKFVWRWPNVGAVLYIWCQRLANCPTIFQPYFNVGPTLSCYLGSTQPCLNSVCHWEYIRKLAIILDPCKHTIEELLHYYYELGRTAKLCHNFPKSLYHDWLCQILGYGRQRSYWGPYYVPSISLEAVLRQYENNRLLRCLYFIGKRRHLEESEGPQMGLNICESLFIIGRCFTPEVGNIF